MGSTAARRKSARPGNLTPRNPTAGDVPAVGGREPCPCGSGRRYKACHGRAAAQAATVLVHRPFAGLAGEADWIALREIVPAATAPLTMAAGFAHPDVPSVTLATLLPMAVPALRREDGSVLVGLQGPGGSGDPSRDIAAGLLRALAADPGNFVEDAGLPGPGPRLQDVLAADVPLAVTVHEGFDFWLGDAGGAAADVAASMERANAAVVPTTRLVSVEAAYWCRMRDRNHLRWVLPHAEEPLLDAMARLHAAGMDSLGEGTRYVGSFRVHGVLAPVWDLPSAMGADDVEDAAAAYGERLGALLPTAPSADERLSLSAEERRARAGLLSRQLTLR
jgi:hypothetical protein